MIGEAVNEASDTLMAGAYRNLTCPHCEGDIFVSLHSSVSLTDGAPDPFDDEEKA